MFSKSIFRQGLSSSQSKSLLHNVKVLSRFMCSQPKHVNETTSDISQRLSQADNCSSRSDALLDNQVRFASSAHPSVDVQRRIRDNERLLAEQDVAKGVTDAVSKSAELNTLVRDDSSYFIFLFPGQGSQFIGMAKDLVTEGSGSYLPVVRSMFERASHILNYDLLKVCLNGPDELLQQTRYCQPATVLASLAAVEKVFAVNPEIVENCIATAGFSVGEITSLIFSGALSFDDGIKLVKARAEAMQYCSQLTDSGMLTIFFGADANLSLATDAAKRYAKDSCGIDRPICQIANHLSSGTKVLAGHNVALDFIQENKSDFGIRRAKRLPVSGAFHTPLMDPATELFKETLENCKIEKPRITVHSNVSLHVYQEGKDVRKILPRQIVRPVKWEQSMVRLFEKYEGNVGLMPQVLECGPGNVLCTVLNRINGKAGSRARKIDV